MDNKFCVECGARISLDARFCRACGRRQPDVVIPSALLNGEKTRVPDDAKISQKTTVDSETVSEKSVTSDVLAATDDVASFPDEVNNDIKEDTKETTEKIIVDATEPLTEDIKQSVPIPEQRTNAEEIRKPDPRPVPDYRSYLNNGKPEIQKVEEIPEPEKQGGIHPGYILLIGCSLFVVALLVWAIFITNKISMTHQSKDKSSTSISIVKPTEPPVSNSHKSNNSSTTGGSVYSGVGGQTDAYVDDGDYTVGKGIDPGTYIFIAEDLSFLADEDSDPDYNSFYAGVFKDANHEKGIHSGWYQTSTYMKLEEGQYLHFSWAKAYPAEEFKGENDPFMHPGMFLVGKDLKPGTYSIEALTDQGYENYTIYESIEDVMEDDGFTNRIYDFDTDDKITLEKGQYIQLEWCRLKH